METKHPLMEPGTHVIIRKGATPRGLEHLESVRALEEERGVVAKNPLGFSAGSVFVVVPRIDPLSFGFFYDAADVTAAPPE